MKQLKELLLKHMKETVPDVDDLKLQGKPKPEPKADPKAKTEPPKKPKPWRRKKQAFGEYVEILVKLGEPLENLQKMFLERYYFKKI